MKDKYEEKKVGCLKRSLSPTTTVAKKLATPQPANNVRFDGFCHWPKIRTKQKRCKACCSQKINTFNVNKDRNWLKDFYTR